MIKVIWSLYPLRSSWPFDTFLKQKNSGWAGR